MGGPWDGLLNSINNLAEAARAAARNRGGASTPPSIDFTKGKSDLINDFAGALFRTNGAAHHVPIRKDGSRWAINLITADSGVNLSRRLLGWTTTQ